MHDYSILNQNQLKLIDFIDNISGLYYPIVDSYLIDCGSTKYTNSQLFKNTYELRCLLEKIKQGSLEDIYPDLFNSGISIDEAIRLLSQFNIIFQSNISIDEAIRLISQFNINFTSSISIDEVIKLLSEFNILFNSGVSIDGAIKLISQFNILFNSEISIDEAIKLLSEFNIMFQSGISLDEAIKLLSEFNIMFQSNVSVDKIVELLSEFNILFKTEIITDTNIDLLTRFKILFNSKIEIQNLNLISSFSTAFNSYILFQDMLNNVDINENYTIENPLLISRNTSSYSSLYIFLAFETKNAFYKKKEKILTMPIAYNNNLEIYIDKDTEVIPGAGLKSIVVSTNNGTFKQVSATPTTFLIEIRINERFRKMDIKINADNKSFNFNDNLIINNGININLFESFNGTVLNGGKYITTEGSIYPVCFTIYKISTTSDSLTFTPNISDTCLLALSAGIKTINNTNTQYGFYDKWENEEKFKDFYPFINK